MAGTLFRFVALKRWHHVSINSDRSFAGTTTTARPAHTRRAGSTSASRSCSSITSRTCSSTSSTSRRTRSAAGNTVAAARSAWAWTLRRRPSKAGRRGAARRTHAAHARAVARMLVVGRLGPTPRSARHFGLLRPRRPALAHHRRLGAGSGAPCPLPGRSACARVPSTPHVGTSAPNAGERGRGQDGVAGLHGLVGRGSDAAVPIGRPAPAPGIRAQDGRHGGRGRAPMGRR